MLKAIPLYPTHYLFSYYFSIFFMTAARSNIWVISLYKIIRHECPLKKINIRRVANYWLSGQACGCIWSEKLFILMESSSKLKIQNASKKCWISPLYWEIERFGSNGFSFSTNLVTHSTILTEVLLCARHISRHSENDRTKSGKNQLKISVAASIYKHMLSILLQHLPRPHSEYQAYCSHLL